MAWLHRHIKSLENIINTLSKELAEAFGGPAQVLALPQWQVRGRGPFECPQIGVV